MTRLELDSPVYYWATVFDMKRYKTRFELWSITDMAKAGFDWETATHTKYNKYFDTYEETDILIYGHVKYKSYQTRLPHTNPLMPGFWRNRTDWYRWGGDNNHV